jgi:hypothetical protein
LVPEPLHGGIKTLRRGCNREPLNVGMQNDRARAKENPPWWGGFNLGFGCT